jgi:hypothetical protein
VDVELREPQDLQTAMYLCAGFRAPPCGHDAGHSPAGGTATAAPSPACAPAGYSSARCPWHATGLARAAISAGQSAPARPFHRLMLAEQLERHR